MYNLGTLVSVPESSEGLNRLTPYSHNIFVLSIQRFKQGGDIWHWFNDNNKFCIRTGTTAEKARDSISILLTRCRRCYQHSCFCRTKLSTSVLSLDYFSFQTLSNYFECFEPIMISIALLEKFVNFYTIWWPVRQIFSLKLYPQIGKVFSSGRPPPLLNFCLMKPSWIFSF